MADKENYIKEVEANMDKYKDKITRIDKLLEKYASENKKHLIEESNSLKEKYRKGEEMLRNLKSSSESTYEKIQETAEEAFERIKEGFHEFSNLLTMEQLLRAKDEIADYGSEKIDELQDYVKKQPLLTAACAFGAGFLIGAVLTRGSR